MPLTRSKLLMNWTGLTVTYGPTPTVINLDEVTDVEIDKKSEPKRWYADGAAYPKAISMKNKQRHLTIKGGDVSKLASIPEDTPCTITGVFNDLYNGISTGALNMTLVNAVVASNPFRGKNNEFGTGDLSFEAFSVDGVADPLTMTETA